MSSPSVETRAETRQAVAEALAPLREQGEVAWEQLSDAGVLGLAVPEHCGGEGLGLIELAPVLDVVGRTASSVPVAGTLAALLTVAEHGSQEQQRHLTEGVAEGRRTLAVALREPGLGPDGVAGVVMRDGTLSGTKIGVDHAATADAVLVTVEHEGAPAVAIVDRDAAGMTLRESATSSGHDASSIDFQDTPATLLGGPEAALTLQQTHTACLLGVGAGALAGTLELTSAYIAGRTQFGRRLAEFQAVAMQISDVYIASRTVTLAASQVAESLALGREAAHDLKVAAYWFATEAPSAAQTCHHLHGGMGVDVTYPLTRFSSLITDIAFALGGERCSLAQVGVEPASDRHPELTEEQRSLKQQLRDYFGQLVAEDDHDDMAIDRHGPTYQAMVRQMGEDGWMGVGWPKEYGGHGFGEVEQTIFANEANYADVHLPSVTLQTVGPTLQAFGTQKQKDLFLGDILAGKVHFAIGYSEPDAGTDLASLRTSARRESGPDGDYYVVNGQKLWTTGGHQADYLWLAVRTDPEAPKHKGISILIVDTKDPGYSWTPIITADGSHHVNATYFNDVRVPADMLVGEENQGWKLITTQLNHERVMLGPAGRLEGLRDRVARWAEAQGVLDHPEVQAALGEVTAAFRVNELLNWEVARAAAQGAISVADASASKVFASDRVQRLGRLLAEVVHAHGDPGEPETARLARYLDAQAKRNLVLTFGGGVNEVQRELIAMFGLKLPRVPR